MLISPHRALRPWLGQVEKVTPPTRPAYDSACYLCPGNERAGGVRNPPYAETFVFDNDFAALLPGAPRPLARRHGGGVDPPRDRRVGRAVRGARRARRHRPRADLREQGRD